MSHVVKDVSYHHPQTFSYTTAPKVIECTKILKNDQTIVEETKTITIPWKQIFYQPKKWVKFFQYLQKQCEIWETDYNGVQKLESVWVPGWVYYEILISKLECRKPNNIYKVVMPT